MESEAIPDLSVVVGLTSGKVEHLRNCLEALADQHEPPSMEILVPYDAPSAEVTSLGRDHPDVRFILAEGLDTTQARAGASREHHDTLRTIGLRNATGRVVALTEDHAVVSATWSSDVVRLCVAHPELAAIGGAVDCKSDGLLNWAVYWCDFGRYQSPLPEGPAVYVSDSNVAYRREALEAIREVWDGDDYHETIVHGALVQNGYEIWLSPKLRVWQARGALSWGWALKERFVWGRSFAGTRVKGSPLPKRLIYAGGCALLPLLLTLRLARGVWRRRMFVGKFVLASPLILLLNCVWSLGEATGYVTGDPGRL